jgi:hypothetical protein
MSMRGPSLLMTVLLAGMALLSPPTRAQSAGDERAWYWSERCPKTHRLRMLIVLEGKSIYQADFRICKKTALQAASGPEQPTRVFHFRGGHVFQGEFHTHHTDIIEGNIWLAGPDTDGLIFGIAFVSKDQGLLNTLHIAKPGATQEFVQDTGLITKTYPLK